MNCASIAFCRGDDKQRVNFASQKVLQRRHPIYVAIRCNYNLTSLKGMSSKNTLSVKINVKSNPNILNLGNKVARVCVTEKYNDGLFVIDGNN